VNGAVVDPPGIRRFHLAPEWTLARSTHFLPQNAPPVLRGTLGQLRNAIHVVGKLAQLQLVLGKASLTLVTSSYGVDELVFLSAFTEGAAILLQQWLGLLPYGRRLLVDDHGAQPFEGAVIGNGVSLLSNAPLAGTATSPAGELIIGQLARSWCAAGPPWLRDGMARYFALLAEIHLDHVDEAAALQRLTAVATADDPASAGARRAFCIDADLRREDSSLLAVFRAARHDAAGAPDEATFLRALARMSPHGRGIADRSEPLPVCLQRAGYRRDATSAGEDRWITDGTHPDSPLRVQP